MTNLDKFMATLKQELLAGIRHGFFECSINSEIIKCSKRRVILKAGKMHLFVIEQKEIDDA
jgi:hypothetical protein